MTNNDAFRTIRAGALETLPVTMPTLERQREIIKIHGWHVKSQALALAISEKRLQHMEAALLRYACGAGKCSVAARET